MRIAVIGPGAMGCLLAASLNEVHEVWLLDYKPNRAAIMAKQGLSFEKNGRVKNCRVNVSADPQLIGVVDLALLCVKSGKVEEALHAAKPLFNQDSLLLTFQNGIAHLPLLPKILGDISWGLGVTSHGATLTSPGHVVHRGQGLTRIGLPPELSNSNDKARKKLALAAQTLTVAGIKTEVTPDILNYIWAKLLVNVGINALTAIHDCPNGVLLESNETAEIMKAAVLEGKQVAEKIGITLVDDPVQITKEVCLATADNISSMLQDVRAKRPTEINAINGALVDKAAALDLPAPVNEELVRRIRQIESKYHDFT